MLRSLRASLLAVALSASLAGSAWSACPQGDLDNDCRVDFNDVKFLAHRWLDPPGSPADLVGGDGVDFPDFAVLAANWGAVGEFTGSLVVAISPPEVILDGAQWQVDGGDWRDTGEKVDLSVGSHTVEFVDVPGWTKPANIVVEISAGEDEVISRAYVPELGLLKVDILPQAAVGADAQWRVDEGAWRNTGTTASSLYVGAHTVEFKEIDGWVSATERTVIINEGQLTAITGTYSQPLVISEFMASNKSDNPPDPEKGELLDEDGDSSDWIEIYNPTDIAIDLGGWYLTNNDLNLVMWEFPAGVVLEAGEFLVVFASEKDRRDPDPNKPLHTNFNLDKSGGGCYLALVGSDGISIVHEYAPEYPAQLSDVSYGLAQNASRLVGMGATAFYHVPAASDAGADWTAVDYFDPTWDTGKISIGFGDITVSSGLNYEYFEGTWDYLPNFDALSPIRRGIVEDFDITPRDQSDYFGFRFTGSIEVPTNGTYTFYTTSDDGSQLFIGSTRVVNNDGLHGMREISGTIYLETGLHPITVTFFEHGGDEGLIVSYAGPGISKREIPGSVLWIGPTTDIQDKMQNVNASLWARMEFDLEEGQIDTFDTFVLRMKYEDGFVAYLNGQLVAWDNAPTNLKWNSAALSDRPIEDSLRFESTNLMPFLDVLRTGRNVLAIHCLNDDKGDGEFLVLPELVSTSDSDIFQYFTLPTPATFNVSGAKGVVGEVWFSRERGFCSGPLDLILSTETRGAEIRYTTDGSRPSASHGSVYVSGSPIRIDKTTPLRAVALKPGYLDSVVMTHTYIFISDVIAQSPGGQLPGPGWPANGAVNGHAMDYGMDPDVVTNDSRYRDLVDDALLAIPSISLATDLANLFDPVIGIYVNPGGHGRGWERPASVELINPDGSDGFHINAGLRIRGGYSRGSWNPKHAFRLFFRSEYGQANLEFPLFEDEGVDEFDKIDLRTSQNYSWSHGGSGHNTMVRDVFSRDIQGATGSPYTRSRYYHLYLNGQYWGLYQTQERSESAFAESYMGPEREDYDVIKTHGMYASDGNRDAIDRLYDETILILNNNDIERYYRIQGLNIDGTPNPDYEKLLDVDNIIDFMVIEYYTGDRDGPASRYT
ncbi:MAG: lamin tail domain-containing protein, partial [Planctomycetes bacterium]|nr:lamin tail domain-containing protein [Planctomycetota bacterium]